MVQLFRSLFMYLSKNSLISRGARNWGKYLGASQFVAGSDVNSAIKTVKQLNEDRYSCTVDHLGEFISDPKESLEAKKSILTVLKKINAYNLNCHISVKLT